MQSNLLYENEKISSNDHVATPRYVVEDIYNLIGIENYNNIWFPFNNYDSEFKQRADELKLKYKATHLFDNLGSDYFVTDPPKECELMISNPPFSKQNDIIKRSFELVDMNLIKSFALLLPLSTLETETRGNVFEQYEEKLSIIIFKKRIKFLGHSTSFNKGCCWICYNIDNLKPFSWV